MENNKIALMLIVLAIMSCTFLTVERSGWYYIKHNDVHTAHREFLRDYAYDSGDVGNTAGLAYTFFMLKKPDSSLVYVKQSIALKPDTSITYFVSVNYYHYYGPDSAFAYYSDALEQYGYIKAGQFIDSVVSWPDLHKLGLVSGYETGMYDSVYSILRRISDIDTTLNMSDSSDRIILLDYINRL